MALFRLVFFSFFFLSFFLKFYFCNFGGLKSLFFKCFFFVCLDVERIFRDVVSQDAGWVVLVVGSRA